MYVIDDRFIYARDPNCNICLYDLEQLRHLTNMNDESKHKPQKFQFAQSLIDNLKFDYAREKLAIMENKLAIRIFPYLHQPRISISKMISDPYNFVLYKVH